MCVHLRSRWCFWPLSMLVLTHFLEFLLSSFPLVARGPSLCSVLLQHTCRLTPPSEGQIGLASSIGRAGQEERKGCPKQMWSKGKAGRTWRKHSEGVVLEVLGKTSLEVLLGCWVIWMVLCDCVEQFWRFEVFGLTCRPWWFRFRIHRLWSSSFRWED